MTPEQARNFIANEAIQAVIHAVKSGKPESAHTLTVKYTVAAEIAEAAASDAPDVSTLSYSSSPLRWTAEGG